MKITDLLQKSLHPKTKKEILEEIEKSISENRSFYHIVSLNPEILVTASHDPEFEKVILAAQMTIVDGVGVRIASLIRGIQVGERYPGVDLMSDMLKIAHTRRLRVLLLGGGPKIAEEVANRQKQNGSQAEFYSSEAFQNISNPTFKESHDVLSIVAAARPHMIFVAFGSPAQEKWIWANRAHLGTFCMGVGGSFNFLSGKTARAPYLLRVSGLEWLFRLATQPWRFKRQLRLLSFLKAVLLGK